VEQFSPPVTDKYYFSFTMQSRKHLSNIVSALNQNNIKSLTGQITLNHADLYLTSKLPLNFSHNINLPAFPYEYIFLSPVPLSKDTSYNLSASLVADNPYVSANRQCTNLG